MYMHYNTIFSHRRMEQIMHYVSISISIHLQTEPGDTTIGTDITGWRDSQLASDLQNAFSLHLTTNTKANMMIHATIDENVQ